MSDHWSRCSDCGAWGCSGCDPLEKGSLKDEFKSLLRDLSEKLSSLRSGRCKPALVAEYRGYGNYSYYIACKGDCTPEECAVGRKSNRGKIK